MSDNKRVMPIFQSPYVRTSRIREKAIEGVRDLFPIIGTHYDIHATNLHMDPHKRSTYSEQKRAMYKGGSIYDPIKATIEIRDKSGKVVSKKNKHTVMHVPTVTGRGTMVVNGNEYAMKHQLRTLPGVYTRRRGNDEMEASFNLSKGANFRVSMDTRKGHLQMEYGTAKIPMYPVLRKLGLEHNDISKYWGKGLADRNRDSYEKKSASAVGKLYERIIPPSKRVHKGTNDKVNAIKDYFENNTELSEETTARTLGKSFNRVTPESLLAASRKLVRVYNEEEEEDDRDSLEFQKVLAPEDLIKERLRSRAREIQFKLRNKLDLAQDVRVGKVMPTATTAAELKKYIASSQLAVLPSQINPIEQVDSQMAVTRLGEGGIASERAIPGGVRKLHPSTLGVIDPFRTPESSQVGVDVRFALGAGRDANGRIYSKLRNLKTGKMEYVPATKMRDLTIAFPEQELKKGNVDVVDKGTVSKVKAGKAQYAVDSVKDMYTVNTNMIPLMDGSQGNRLIMGSKMVGQALPLVMREEPLVQSAVDSKESTSMEEVISEMSDIRLFKDRGTAEVTEVTKDAITIKRDGKVDKVSIANNLPMASKTFFHHSPVVKVGDKLKPGAILAKSNFTRNGKMALGKNMNIAYLAYHGLNSNDAVVISKGAAEKLSSVKMSKYVIEEDKETRVDHNKHSANFPRIFNKDQYSKLNKGVVRVGQKLKAGDPIATVLRKRPPSIENQVLGKIHKSLRQEFSDNSEVWDSASEGEVVAVEKEGKRTTVIVKSVEKMKLGDKVSNRYGGKGVVSKIVDDEDMVQDESGKPIDMLWSSLGVVSRINPAQVVETALAKVARKRGKAYKVASFKNRNNVEFARQEMKKHGVKDKETVYDPITGKKIPNIMVGPQYTYKLFKSTDTNYSARGIDGSYDVNDLPAKGGITGAKGTGIMEINALLAHDARDILKENAILKGTRNSEYWRAMQLGRPLPPPKTNFAFDKFKSMLVGAGLNLQKQGNQMAMAPLTDSDVEKMSNGEIQTGRMVISKNLKPERGGLFDLGVTGGLTGTKLSHIELPDSVMNPIFEDAARRLVGETKAGLRDRIAQKGGDVVRRQLNSLDPDKLLPDLQAKLKKAKGSNKDNYLKQVKALTALKENGLKAGDAYMMKKFPVIPPIHRPVVPGAKGDLLISDVNHVYKDLVLAKDKLKEAIDLDLPDEDVAEMRKHVSDAAAAVIGTAPPVSKKLQTAEVKGIVNTITGTKTGFFNGKVLSRRLDFTGRGTAAPDPTLGMDEVGLPEDMMWSMYSPFIMKNLVKKGYPALQAKKLLEDRSLQARESLALEAKNRPVIINRAPSLHRFNMISAFPRMVSGKTITVNPFMEDGQNLDYDGDALQVHLPVTDGAVNDSKKMLLSNNTLGDKRKDQILAYPKHEAIAGIHKALTDKKSGRSFRFNSVRDALAAYRRGEVKPNDEVEVPDELP